MSTNHTEHLSDSELLAHVAQALTNLHREPPDSFVLHAPLELMARAELLALVSPIRRDEARARIATTSSLTGATTPTSQVPVLDDPLATLQAALVHGDIDTVDHAYQSLCQQRSTAQVITDLAGPVQAHLGGAGHASIFSNSSPASRPSV